MDSSTFAALVRDTMPRTWVRSPQSDANPRLCMYGHTYSKSMDQPGKVASPARGQLNRKYEYFPVRVRA